MAWARVAAEEERENGKWIDLRHFEVRADKTLLID